MFNRKVWGGVTTVVGAHSVLIFSLQRMLILQLNCVLMEATGNFVGNYKLISKVPLKSILQHKDGSRKLGEKD